MKINLIMLFIFSFISVEQVFAQIGSAVVYLKSDSVMNITVDKIYKSSFLDHQGNGIPYFAIDSLVTPDSVIVNQMRIFISQMKIEKRTNGYFISEIVPSQKVIEQKNNISHQTKDIVYLKNGSIIRGDIVEQILNESVKIQTANGSYSVYNMSKIEKIIKDTIANSGLNVSLEQPKVAIGITVLATYLTREYKSFHASISEQGVGFGVGAFVIIPISRTSSSIGIGGDYSYTNYFNEILHFGSIYVGPKFGEAIYFLPAVSYNLISDRKNTWGLSVGGGVLIPLGHVKLNLGTKISAPSLFAKNNFFFDGIFTICAGVVF